MEIVELAIIADHILAVGGHHGLVATGRQVNNRQTAVAQTHKTVGIKAFSIRPPMGNRVGHLAQNNRRDRFAI